MHVKTLLNACHRIKGFVYTLVRFEEVDGQKSVVAHVRPREASRPVCSGCGRKSSGYDTAREARLFQFVPLWGFQCYLRYRLRRVDCRRCGVKVERVPWARGKRSLCHAYELFLARWARRLSWQQTAEAFHTSWHKVFSSVKAVVRYGLRHRSLEGIEAIGVDEWQWRKGHDYVTLVYQIQGDCRRLLYVTPKRTVRSLLGFFRMLGKERTEQIRYVCSDMWRPYLKVIAKKDSAGAAHPRPLPHRGESEQGPQRDPRGGSQASQARRLRGSAQAHQILFREKPGESHRQAEGPSGRGDAV